MKTTTGSLLGARKTEIQMPRFVHLCRSQGTSKGTCLVAKVQVRMRVQICKDIRERGCLHMSEVASPPGCCNCLPSDSDTGWNESCAGLGESTECRRPNLFSSSAGGALFDPGVQSKAGEILRPVEESAHHSVCTYWRTVAPAPTSPTGIRENGLA